LVTVLALNARRANAPKVVHALAWLPGTCAWVIGGLFDLAVFGLAQIDTCTGTGFGSFACANRPVGALNTLGVLSAASATIAGILLLTRARSRLSAWLAPVLIFGLYLLALRLWQPHVGLGAHSPPPGP
jgi:hypothetical protein